MFAPTVADVERKQIKPFVRSNSVGWVARDNVPCRESEGRALGRVWDRVPAGCRGRAHAQESILFTALTSAFIEDVMISLSIPVPQ